MAVLQEFHYRAVDPRGGGVVKGVIEAPTESAVTGKLKAQGLTPLEVTLKSKTGLNREIKLPGGAKHVSAKSLAVFSRQMAGLINAGLPLMRTLSILIEQTDDKKLQPALVQVQADVESGSSFSAALGAAPADLPTADAEHRARGRERRLPRRRAVVDRRELPARGGAAEQDPRRRDLSDHRAHHRDDRRARHGDLRRAGLREHVREPRLVAAAADADSCEPLEEHVVDAAR